MAKTKNDLAREAALELRIIASDEQLSAADAEYIKDKYDRKLQVWRDDGLVYWPNTDDTTAEIPDLVFDAVAKALCGEIYRAFGVREEPTVMKFGRLMTLSEAGVKELRQVIARRSANEDLVTVSY